MICGASINYPILSLLVAILKNMLLLCCKNPHYREWWWFQGNNVFYFTNSFSVTKSHFFKFIYLFKRKHRHLILLPGNQLNPKARILDIWNGIFDNVGKSTIILFKNTLLLYMKSVLSKAIRKLLRIFPFCAD